MDTVQEEVYKSFKLRVEYDEHGCDPREWDNIGIMTCFHGRYNLGDKHCLNTSDFSGWDDIQTHLVEEEGAIVILPLYLYDHSGITMRTTPFHCPWDSGVVGFIYTTREQVKKLMGWKRISKDRLNKLKDYLIGEVETYDQYLRGECYGYIIERLNGDFVDSCWGYLGDPDYAMDEARHSADYEFKHAMREHSKQVKAWILNGVPLDKRYPFKQYLEGGV